MTSKSFFAPWDESLRCSAALLELHCALCRAANLPYDTNPVALPADVTPTGAVDPADLFGWHPKGYDASVGDPLTQVRNPAWEHLAAWGGRGGSKSHKAAEAIVEAASVGKERVAGAREYMARIKESSKELLEQKIKASRWAEDWETTEYELRNKRTGSVIFFVGLAGHNAESVAKALEGITILWTDEAQLLTQRSLDLVLPTIRVKNSRCIWTWNPGQQPTPIDELFRYGEPPERSLVKCMLVEDNPYLYTTRLASDMRSSYHRDKAEKFRHIWRGAHLEITDATIFTDIATGYLDWTQIDSSEINPQYGMDFSNGGKDPHAVVQVYLIPVSAIFEAAPEQKPILYITREAVANNVPVHALGDMVAQVGGAGATVLCDSANPTLIAELNAGAVCNAEPAVKGPGSVNAGLQKLQSCHILVAPENTIVLAELKGLRWATDPKTGKLVYPLKPVGADHCVDAVRYSLSETDLKGQYTGKPGKVTTHAH